MKVHRSILILVLLSLQAAFVWAVDPVVHISQYAHTAWRVQDGVFSGTPYVIAQTTDGYIWVGTQNGLFRFDGAGFAPWAPPNRGKQLNPQVLSLYVGHDGALWIGMAGKLAKWKNGELTSISVPLGMVNAIAEDRNGKVWLTESRTATSKPLCEILDAKAVCHGSEEGLPHPFADTLAVDAAGSIWVGSTDTLVHWKPGPASLYTFNGLRSNKFLYGITALAGAPNGSLYVGLAIAGPGLGLEQITNGVIQPVIAPGFDGSSLQVEALFFDSAGTLWIGTQEQGLYRVHGNEVEHYDSKDGLSGDSVRSIFEDHEGNVWVATAKGVDCFRDLKVLSWSMQEGLTADDVKSVEAGRDGTVWIGTDNALDVLRNGKVSSIGAKEGLPGSHVTSVLEDHFGRLWVGVDDKLAIYANGKFRLIHRSDGQPTGTTVALAEDVDGNIWASVIGHAPELLRIRGFEVAEAIPSSVIPQVFSLAADPQSGVWLGLYSGDLALYRHGHYQLITTGIKAMAITSLAVNADGSVLASTRAGGIIGWQEGRVRLLNSANGLPCDSIASLVISDRHSLLLSSLCGLIQIEEEELQKWWKNPKAQIAYSIFDSLDGARVSPTSFEPRISKGIDGKIWFANKTELQMFDPDHVAENRVVPPVHIEEVIADRKTYGISNSVSLPPLTRDLEIRYVALSFVTPQKVRFRYKLEGHDADWQEPGGRREAFYENLAPGHYRFRVIACNNDGIWNETGASQDFSIQPTWYQTSWFRILSALCVLLLFWTIYRLRVRYIARAIGARFDERLAERTRMARELHDTFLQTVQGSKMVADDALDEGSNEARMRYALERLSLWLGQAVTEGRAALHALRISTTERNHLAESLRQAAEDNCGPASLSLALTVIGDPKDLHPIVRDEISRIGYEAIRNACMHSHSSQLEIELRYAEDLTVAVKDNGVGIDPTVAHDGKDGHFGLQGMRERAARIRGKLTIVSTISAGTTVTLRVPGNLVYRNGPITILERTKRALRRLIGTPDIVETDGGSQ